MCKHMCLVFSFKLLYLLIKMLICAFACQASWWKISEYFFPIMVQQPHESNADEDSLTTKSEGHSLSGACNFDFN